MADYFETLPNFVNPQYSTPEQLAAQRAYADALMKRSGQEVTRPAGAIGNMLDAVTAALYRRNADTLQTQAAKENARMTSDLVSQMQSGQPINPQTLGAIIANPLVSPEQRALALELMRPKGVEDVRGRPGYASPAAGVHAAPVSGGFEPGYRAPETAGSVSTTTAIPADQALTRDLQRSAAQREGRYPYGPVPSTSRTWGDKEAEAAGLYPPTTPTPGGPRAMGASPSPAPSGSRIQELAGLDRELTAAKTFSQGGAESISNVQREDVAAAMNAPNIKRIAGTMLDDLRKHGDQMTFGPTAEWSNNVKRIAANYAPGLMRNQIEALASADSFDKMSAQLTGMLARGGGTDAQLFQNMRSVPGAHNSKQGAEALLLMVNQVADQQAALREYVSRARSPQEYEALRSQFFRENPIINPITGNPVALDLQRGGGGSPGGARIISVRPAR